MSFRLAPPRPAPRPRRGQSADAGISPISATAEMRDVALCLPSAAAMMSETDFIPGIGITVLDFPCVDAA